MAKDIHQVLHDLQVALKVPKDQWNDFGKYPYRNAESILQAVKPLLPDGYSVVVDITPVTVPAGAGIRIICKATASLVCADNAVRVDAYAVEPESKKGMDSAQVSGATISYAKKYALGNLLAIDGNRDSDSTAPETPSGGPRPKGGAKSRKKAQEPPHAAVEPQVTIVPSDEQLADTKRALFRAMQAYAERAGRDVSEIVAATFDGRPAEEWTIDELQAKADEFEGAL